MFRDIVEIHVDKLFVSNIRFKCVWPTRVLHNCNRLSLQPTGFRAPRAKDDDA